jgi:hypothetical protein
MARRLLQQDYYVRLKFPGARDDGKPWTTCYTARVSYRGWGRVPEPSKRTLEADASRQAIAAFGRQARGWKFLDAEKATKRPRPVR